MSISMDQLIDEVSSQLEVSPMKNQIAGALKSCLEQQSSSLEALFAARQQGDISEQEFEIEVEREKSIIEAEMLTWQITAKSEVQKVVNKAFDTLKDTII